MHDICIVFASSYHIFNEQTYQTATSILKTGTGNTRNRQHFLLSTNPQISPQIRFVRIGVNLWTLFCTSTSLHLNSNFEEIVFAFLACFHFYPISVLKRYLTVNGIFADGLFSLRQLWHNRNNRLIINDFYSRSKSVINISRILSDSRHRQTPVLKHR